MKKNFFKTLLSATLALVLAFVATVSANTSFAAATGSGTITVENTGSTAEYKAYKIFDATYKGDAVSYTIPDGLVDTYKGNAKFNELFETQTNGGKTYVTRKDTATDTAIAGWAKEIAASAGIQASDTKSGNGSSITLNVPYGYYFVSTTLSDGATVMVTSVNPSATIQEKNNEPDWGGDGKKAVDKESKTFAVGETVNYTLTYNNATRFTKGEKITKYVVKDTLPEGVKFGDITSVKVNGNSLNLAESGNATNTYIVAKDSNGFTITIPWAATDDANNKDFYYDQVISKIEVKYSGTLTKEAEKGSENSDKNKNIAKINPNDKNTDEGKTEYVYTGQITIDKVNEFNEKLEGAEFVLKKDAKFLKVDEETKNVSWVDSQDQATTFKTDAQGSATISGLDEGKYNLVETKAPDGYNLLTEAKEVELSKSNDKLKVTAEVVNKKGSQLPSTGGMGTTILYTLGAIFVIGGTVVLLARRRARM